MDLEALRILAGEGGQPLPSAAVSLIEPFGAHGIATAIACETRAEQEELQNARQLKDAGASLTCAGVSSGYVALADLMDVSPIACVVVTARPDRAAEASRSRFAGVVGARSNSSDEQLLRAGVNTVIGTVEDLSPEIVREWRERGLERERWRVRYIGFAPAEERLREALTTIGNGYFGTRGALASEPIDDTHNPGTYVHNLYNRAGTDVHGKTIYNNDFVNCPNWTLTTVHLCDGERLSPHTCEVVRYEHELDMLDGIVRRRMVLRDGKGRTTKLETERFASMANPKLAALRVRVTPLDHNEPVTVRTSIDGGVINYLVERYRDLEQHHLSVTECGGDEERAWLTAQTRDGQRTVGMEAATAARIDGNTGGVSRSVESEDARVTETFHAGSLDSGLLTLEKLVAIGANTDEAASQRRPDPRTTLEHFADYKSERERHTAAWRRLWKRAEITVTGDRFACRMLRLHSYHLLSTASPHNAGLDAGLPARGLHGEAYRGHIFWDELFILPYYIRRFPEIARSHLLYRYRRLDAARALAEENGYRGAMYPWQSAATGGPESQQVHYNPASGEWDPDLSSLQRHIGISIGYNVYRYCTQTDDADFLARYGMEMLLEIARFFASLADYELDDDRYHINGVMGPDEFHERYPGASLADGGFRDNSYTNVMAAWLLDRCATLFRSLPEETRSAVQERIHLQESELHEWDAIATRMKVPFADGLLLEQFEGYLELDELDWGHYRQEYGSTRRMDRILKAEDDSPDNYQVSKQADVLMLFYLLSPEEVSHLLEQLGYGEVDGVEMLRQNYDYYEPRTSHGSTLSWIVHGAILNELNDYPEQEREFFRNCLESDVFDTQGGTTLEGIHCGVMAGSIDMVLSRYCRLRLHEDLVELHPSLPDGWTGVRFTVENRGALLRVEVERTTDGINTSVTRLNDTGPDMTVTSGTESYPLPSHERVELHSA